MESPITLPEEVITQREVVPQEEESSGVIKKPLKVLNRKGRSTRTQNIRSGKEKRKVETKPEYEVEDILQDKIEDGEVLYFVKWKGYTTKQGTWEPEKHLTHCKSVLQEYKRKQLELAAAKADSMDGSTLNQDKFDKQSKRIKQKFDKRKRKRLAK